MTVNFNTMYPTGMSNLDLDNLMNAPVLSANTAMGMPSVAGTLPSLTGYAGMGMGYTGLGTFGGMLNPQYQQAYMQNMQQWDNFGIDRQVQMYQNQNNAQFKMASQNQNIQRQVQILNSQIKADNQDNVKAEYNKLLAAVETAYGSQIPAGTSAEDRQAQIKAYAERLYAQQTGSYITDDIRSNSSSSFMSGLKQVLSFGFGSNTTADENIASIEGTTQTKKSKGAKIAGNIVGGLLGGAVAVGAFLLGKGLFKKA
mgnify:FL=1